jgi:hypothetical protein
VGRGRPDAQGVVIAGDAGKAGNRLDVDQAVVVQKSFLHRQKEFGAAGIQTRRFPIMG